MKKKILGRILQAPLLLVMIASFIAGIYAAANNIGGVGASVPVIIAIVIILYFYGRYLEAKGIHDWI